MSANTSGATYHPTTTGDTDSDEFSKRVKFQKLDDDEQIARGAVLVPNRLDHQGDFLRASTIADLRENFKARVEDRDALPGVMHAVFPENDDVELVDDRQLDEPEVIGSKELPAGTWVQTWKYHDDELWALVRDGILGGQSIGGTAKGRIYDPGALPDDVSIPDPVQSSLDDAGLTRDDIVAREITEGSIYEVSDVDYPAVPDAVHAEHKSLSKAADALTQDVVAARIYLEARGHDEQDAKRLAEYLNDQKAAAADPDSDVEVGTDGDPDVEQGQDRSGLVARARDWLGKSGSGSSSGGDGDDGETQSRQSPEEKAGRTLSESNVRAAKSVVDSALTMLDASDVDHGRQKFSDDESDPFTLDDYDGKARDVVDADQHEAAADDSDSDDSTMTDSNDAPEWAQDLKAQVEDNAERLDDIADKNTDPDADEKADDVDADEQPPEWAKSLVEQVDANAERVEQMADAAGASQQADQGTTKADDQTKTWDNSPFAAGGN